MAAGRVPSRAFRAGACSPVGIIASVREMFANTTERRTLVHLEDVGRQVLGFLRTNAISVETDFRDGIPRVHADPTQIKK